MPKKRPATWCRAARPYLVYGALLAAGVATLPVPGLDWATDIGILVKLLPRINEAFGMEQKLRMVEHMWRVAYADGTLSAHENHVMWRVSDLLYIPHGAYVSAKMRARDAASGA